jgi:diguanylate cyclase (GGDEF)-like protein
MDLREALFIFIVIICSLSMMSWIVIAFAMRIAPKASISFVTINFLFVIACILFLQRDNYANFLVWNFCDLLVLYALGITRFGILSLFKIPPPFKEFGIVLGTFTAIYCFIPPSADSVYWFSLFFSSGSAYMFARLSLDVRVGVRELLPKMQWLIIAWPFIIASGAMLLRIVLQVTETATVYVSGPEREENLSFLWFFIVLSLVVNLILYSVVVGRLFIKVRYEAEHDDLTQAINTKKFRQVLSAQYEQCQHDGRTFSIVLFDIDNFKKINDEYGHSVGDEALKHVAEQVFKVIRQDDVFARVGGEEFIIMLTPNEELFVEDISEKVRAQLEHNPLIHEETPIVVTASFGCASSAYYEADEIMSAADEAMYRSKRQGKNCINVAKKAEHKKIPEVGIDSRAQTPSF